MRKYGISIDLFLQGRDTWTILKIIGESLFIKTHFSYFEKCPSEYTAECPSKQIPRKVSF